MIRLDKYLADMGMGTRKELKQKIKKGMVTVDGITEMSPERKIRTEENLVHLEGKPVCYAAYEYFMLNKPAGVISATEDRHTPTVLDLIDSKKRKDLFPVGRLDKDTEGLLLITNDGALAHRLLSPKKHVDKVYYAKVAGQVTKKTAELFAGGIDIGKPGEKEFTKPARLEIIDVDEEKNLSLVRLTIQEGKFHQVKRMFLAVGMEVLYLKREAMGSLVLDETLKPSEYRELTEQELEKLL